MGSGLRDVQRRIRTVKSTKKITRAMELIAASKVVKAQGRMNDARPYAEAITRAVNELASAGGNLSHSFLTPRATVSAAAIIVVTSDRGLAGAYSSSVVRAAEELSTRLRHDGVEPKIYVTGRKGTAYYRFRGRPVVDSYVGFSDHPVYDNVKPLADAAVEAYRSGEVDEIYVVHTEFVSLLTQRPEARRLLPLEVREAEYVETGPVALYDYEPEPEVLLDALLPRYLESRIYSAFLEAAASELAARRRAMSTATENATNIIEDLTRQYNRARQAEITQELMEVVGAAESFTGSN